MSWYNASRDRKKRADRRGTITGGGGRDRLRVSLHGKLVAFPQSFGIAHEAKSGYQIMGNGPGPLFEDIRMWNVR